jgi:hypothetical protein
MKIRISTILALCVLYASARNVHASLSVTNMGASNILTTATILTGGITGTNGTASNVVVTVYWGTWDGGTNASSWGNSVALGEMTNNQAFATNTVSLTGNTVYWCGVKGVQWNPLVAGSNDIAWATSLSWTTKASNPTSGPPAQAVVNAMVNTNGEFAVPTMVQFAADVLASGFATTNWVNTQLAGKVDTNATFDLLQYGDGSGLYSNVDADTFGGVVPAGYSSTGAVAIALAGKADTNQNVSLFSNDVGYITSAQAGGGTNVFWLDGVVGPTNDVLEFVITDGVSGVLSQYAGRAQLTIRGPNLAGYAATNQNVSLFPNDALYVTATVTNPLPSAARVAALESATNIYSKAPGDASLIIDLSQNCFIDLTSAVGNITVTVSNAVKGRAAYLSMFATNAGTLTWSGADPVNLVWLATNELYNAISAGKTGSVSLVCTETNRVDAAGLETP